MTTKSLIKAKHLNVTQRVSNRFIQFDTKFAQKTLKLISGSPSECLTDNYVGLNSHFLKEIIKLFDLLLNSFKNISLGNYFYFHFDYYYVYKFMPFMCSSRQKQRQYNH